MSECQKIKKGGGLDQYGAERFIRLIFATIRKSVGLQGLKTENYNYFYCIQKSQLACCRQLTQTDCDVTGTVHLQKLVEMLPHAWNPLHHVVCSFVTRSSRRPALRVTSAATGSDLGVRETPSEIACQESVDGFHVISAQHPAEIVM